MTFQELEQYIRERSEEKSTAIMSTIEGQTRKKIIVRRKNGVVTK